MVLRQHNIQHLFLGSKVVPEFSPRRRGHSSCAHGGGQWSWALPPIPSTPDSMFFWRMNHYREGSMQRALRTAWMAVAVTVSWTAMLAFFAYMANIQ
jgi:hypothetical protein